MIGVDTNVVVRLLVGDDARQAAAAVRFLKQHSSSDAPARLLQVVLVETVWVLEDVYEYSRSQIASAVDGLLATAQLRCEDSSIVGRALHLYRSSAADFADCLIGVKNTQAGCEFTATFDRKAARLTEFRRIGAE